ncbi:hypothetical protein SDC9_125667 [bioreactor metagenome]|uniref:Uncharacterized protein n=1 Tax=bioreactor metagenome TaxID=1076179 RepID=A0A645CNP6_9ZZZZ
MLRGIFLIERLAQFDFSASNITALEQRFAEQEACFWVIRVLLNGIFQLNDGSVAIVFGQVVLA